MNNEKIKNFALGNMSLLAGLAAQGFAFDFMLDTGICHPIIAPAVSLPLFMLGAGAIVASKEEDDMLELNTNKKLIKNNN